jgi:hypothetical protein
VFQRGMCNVPKTVLFIHLNLIFLSECLTGPNQKAYFVKFSHPVSFVVLIRGRIRIRIRKHLGTDPDPGKLYGSGSATLLSRVYIKNRGVWLLFFRLKTHV